MACCFQCWKNSSETLLLKFYGILVEFLGLFLHVSVIDGVSLLWMGNPFVNVLLMLELSKFTSSNQPSS